MNFIDRIRSLFKKKKVEDFLNHNNSRIEEKNQNDDLINLSVENSEDIISISENTHGDNYAKLLNNYNFKYLIERFFKIELKNKNDLNSIPSTFLDKCLNDKFLEYLSSILYLLDENIFFKIVNNTLSINDLPYNLINLCEFMDLSVEEKDIYEVLKSRKVLNVPFKDCVIVDMYDDFKVDEKEYEIMIDTYIPNVKIYFDKIKYSPLGNLYSDAEIKVINPINIENDLFSGGYRLGDNVIKDEAIIILSLKKYIELCKNKKNLDIFSKHQFIITDNLSEINSLPNDLNYRHNLHLLDKFLSYELEQNIKNNHLIKIIKDSNLSENGKSYYCYMLQNESNNFIFNFNNLIFDIVQKVGMEKINSITKEFNLMSINEKMQQTSNFEYSIKVFLYTYPNYFELDKETQIDILLNLSEREFEVLIKEKELLNFFLDNSINSRDELIKLKKLLKRISNIRSNETILEFLDRHNIDALKFIKKGNGILKSDYELNPIVSKYKIPSQSIFSKSVSLVDIVGFPNAVFRNQEHNILDIIGNFYNKNGDSYYTRSISMLEYMNGYDAMKGLMKTFYTEYFGIDEIEGKYIVSENGRHRFTILRFLYEKDLIEGKLSEEELREKYMIPNCKVNFCDYDKTYLNYLYHVLDSNVHLIMNVSNDEEINDKLRVFYHNGVEVIKTIQELKIIINNLLDNIDLYDLNKIRENYIKYSSFKNFMDNNFPKLKKIIDESEIYQDGKSVGNM